MKIKTIRFGEIEAGTDTLVSFPHGLIGFENLKQFCIFNKEEVGCFWWLQSVEKPETAFLITDPRCLVPDYSPAFTKEDILTLHARDSSDVEVGVILTIPDDPRETTANLLAPIAINMSAGIGMQIALKDNRYSTKHILAQPVLAGNSEGGATC